MLPFSFVLFQFQPTLLCVCGTHKPTPPSPSSQATRPPSPACTSARAHLSSLLHRATPASACGALRRALPSSRLQPTRAPPSAALRGRLTRHWLLRAPATAACACGNRPRGCSTAPCSALRQPPLPPLRSHQPPALSQSLLAPAPSQPARTCLPWRRHRCWRRLR
jgi:hypothetical protein